MSDRIIQRVKKHLYSSAMTKLEELRNAPHRPQGMAYFEEMIQTFYDPGKPAWGNKKVVGTFCMMVPEELIYAAGALPVRLCAGSHEAASLVEEILPSGACPMVKSIVGFVNKQLSPLYESCDAMVIPTTCDWKKKLGEILLTDKPVWLMEVPQIKETEASRRHWDEEITGLKQKLEGLTGNKITGKGLREAIKTMQRVQGEYRRFYQLRMNKPPLISGRDALLVMQSYFYAEADTWADNLKLLNNELEQKLTRQAYICPPAAARILLTGSPVLFPNWNIPDLIETHGGIIVMDEFCTSGRYIYDLVAVDEMAMSELLKAIAERYILPCTCPCFTPNIDRMNKVLQMIEDFQVQGVVYHVLRGCHPYDFEVHRFEKKFQQLGIPLLRLETDYSPEDVEQIRTRVEAFLETICKRKGGN